MNKTQNATRDLYLNASHFHTIQSMTGAPCLKLYSNTHANTVRVCQTMDKSMPGTLKLKKG